MYKNILHGKNHDQQSKNQMSNTKKNVLHIMHISLIYKELLEIDKTKTNNPRGK